MTDASAPDVVVVGGGISALALALRLHERGRRVLVVDAAERPGGNFQTKRVATPEGEWLLDLGPNSFGDAATELMDLIGRAGALDRLVRAPDTGGRRWLYRDGRLREVPSSPPKFLASPILPLSARLRLLAEPFIRPRPADAPEESLAQFCDRRLGRPARKKLLTPVVGGIYAGDPEELGAESSFPRMVALEREHGSLIRAAMKGAGPPSRGRLSNFAGGMTDLPAAIAARLGGAISSGNPVLRIEREGALWRVVPEKGGAIMAQSVVIATPAFVAGELLEILSPAAAHELFAIRYAPMAVVHVGVQRGTAVALPEGFGFLVPREEGLRILGAIFSSHLFPGRAPEGHHLVTVFAGGRLDPEAPDLPEDDLRAFVLSDLRAALGDIGEPALFHVTRWPRAIPQYEVGHRARLGRIAEATRPLAGLHLLGNWKGGIAMPDCVRAADALADVLAAQAPAV